MTSLAEQRPSASLTTGATRSSNDWASWIVLFVVLVAIRIPFILTHHIWEDAYITFRSAFHLADFGTLSYNLGEHQAGLTSPLYGVIVALIRKCLGRFAIEATVVIGTIVFELAALLLSKALPLSSRQQRLFFVLVSLLPVALVISYTGMEIPYQVLAIASCLYLLRDGDPGHLIALPLFFLPLIRPDAVAYAILITLLVAAYRRRVAATAFIATLLGLGSHLLFDKAINGSFIPDAMRAKEVSYHPSHNIAAILHHGYEVFFTRCFAAPVPYFLARIGGLLILLYAACALTAFRQHRDRPARWIFAFLFISGIAVPACYAFGGVIFPWYIYTSSWLIAALGCYQIAVWSESLVQPKRRLLCACAAAIWAVLACTQYCLSLRAGIEEYDYRASIGRDIAKVAQPGDSLVLEPAGYIPFFAGIRTEDEVGLASGTVVRYRIRYGNQWFMKYLEEQPTRFLVEKEYFEAHRTIDGAEITPGDWNWFRTHYRLVRMYHYDPAAYIHSRTLRRILYMPNLPLPTTYSLYERRK